MQIISKEIEDYSVLLRNIPGLVLAMFILSVVLMNLLANKELISYEYLALDCGYLLSWCSFLCMDVLCKHFGGRAAVKVAILALFINLLVTGIFYLVSLTPGHWAEFYATESELVNTALNNTFGGTWYVVLGSSLAMLSSAIVNAAINMKIGAKLVGENFKNFAIRSYISTFIGQFVDNLVFTVTVSYVFFGWTPVQIVICAITGAVVELVFEILFSGIGYNVILAWQKHNIGAEYLRYQKER